MKKIRIGQIGIGHNHGEAKMLAIRKFPELFEVVGIAEEDPVWMEQRGNLPGYDGLPRLSVDELLSKCDAILVEGAVPELTRIAQRCVDAGKHIHMDKPGSGTLEEFKRVVGRRNHPKRLPPGAADHRSIRRQLRRTAGAPEFHERLRHPDRGGHNWIDRKSVV